MEYLGDWRLESGSNAWAAEGGDWLLDASGSSQTFTYVSDKDISMDVTRHGSNYGTVVQSIITVL
jgi:hypothetical protein